MPKTKNVCCLIQNKNKEFLIDVEKWQETAQNLFKNLCSHDEILKDFCLKNKTFENIFFDITFTDKSQTHELNRAYRDKDYPADIITFALFADDTNAQIIDGEVVLGDIIIALDKIQEMAAEENNSFDYELKFLIAHGILHLLGFDHQTAEEYNFVVRHQNQAIEELTE